MIKVKNIDKYFNKNKNNEIHVIDQTNLEFPTTGLVCLLGASGSGKTTLLNVVGGLDKIDSGEIEFKEYSIKKYKASQWDNIRNRHFGYIFQNYILLPELTVYQNLELVLKILNLEKEEIDKRIDYALEAVGMLKYKKRKPTQLSGGQQQRVAIARALVKSPDVVIADEPTGNLDEKNTTQIMSIIKKISKECLVILVTHERKLAEFYGDRIIELKDGKVIDDIVVHSTGDFQEVDNNNIYLQEFDKQEAVLEDLNVKYFYKDIKAKLDLNIIFKDNTFYIQSPIENVKIKFLHKNNEIKVIDSKKPVISQQDIEEFDYHIPKVEHKSTKKDSVIKFSDTLKMALRHLGRLKGIQKFLSLVLFLSTIMITIGFINLFASIRVDEEDFLYFNRNLVITDLNYTNLKSKLGEDDMVLYQPYMTSVANLSNGYFFVENMNSINLRNPANTMYNTNSAVPISLVKDPKLLYGKLPTKNGEAVIDKYLIDLYLDYPAFTSVGIKYEEQFLGLQFSTNGDMGFSQRQYTIVGIIDNNNPNIYITESDYKAIMIYNKLSVFDLGITQPSSILNNTYQVIDSTGKRTETNLSIPTLTKNQALVNNVFYAMSIEKTGSNILNLMDGTEIEVLGIVDFGSTGNFGKELFITDETVDGIFLDILNNNYSIKEFVIYANNPEELLEKLDDGVVKAQTLYEQEYERVKLQTMNLDLFISSIVVLIGAMVFLYFLMRSSMMSRIYQIGVYRALGIRKSNIYRIFFTEILIISLVTALIGIGIVSIVVNRVNSLIDVIYYPWFLPPVVLLFIFVVNTVVGLLPVNTLLRLTPSQILSKYDI